METGIRVLTATDINTVTPTKQDTLGAVGATADGRRFRYVGFAGTSTVNAGLVLVSAAKTANSNALAVTAVGTGGQTTANLAAGSTTLVVTNGVTSVTQDQFADGFVEVLWSGGDFCVRINGNTAAGSGGYITLSLATPLQANAALVAGVDTVNLTASPYAAATSTTTKSAPLGVTVVQVVNTATVSNYGWVQSGGHAFVSATTATKGQAVTQDTAGTAGYIMSTAAATDYPIGVAKESAANTSAAIELNLA